MAGGDMNRIKISSLAIAELEAKREASSPITALKPESQSPASLPPARSSERSLFVPQHCEAKYAYPLIVWLHGDGSDCGELQQVMPRLSVRNYLAIAPQSSFTQRSISAWPDSSRSLQFAYDQVMRCIDDTANRFRVHSGRIFLAGCGSGGRMALRLAFERPDIFAGVASIDGALGSQNIRLQNLDRCRKLNVFLGGFRQSESYRESAICTDMRLLHAAGFATTVRQYPGRMKLNDKVLADLNRWAMEQISSAIC